MMSGKEALLLVIAASCCIYGCFAENVSLFDKLHLLQEIDELEYYYQ